MPNAFAAAAVEESVQKARNVWVTLRRDNLAGSGSQHDPFNGSGEKFDVVMARTKPGTHIHLGPGVFLTRGVHLKNNWWLQGSGKNQHVNQTR